MKAIETKYNGNLYRSRHEARFAVFFDALKIRYQYELEGYELNNGTRYLPDFWLPELDLFVEVKPEAPDEKEKIKARFLCAESQKVVFFGIDLEPSAHGFAYVPPGRGSGFAIHGRCLIPTDCNALFGLFTPVCFGECEGCQQITLTSSYFVCRCPHCGSDVFQTSERLVRAYGLARRARFEFGKEPMRGWR